MTRLTYTMLRGELEYLKTKTSLKDERFERVTGEWDLNLILSKIRRTTEVEESIRLTCTVLLILSSSCLL